MLKKRVTAFITSAIIAISFIFLMNNSIQGVNFDELVWKDNPNSKYPITYVPVDIGTRAISGCQSSYWQNSIGTNISKLLDKNPNLIQKTSFEQGLNINYFITNEDGSKLFFETDKNGIIQQLRCQ